MCLAVNNIEDYSYLCTVEKNNELVVYGNVKYACIALT